MIDLVARLFNLSSYEAAQKLALDFGLDPETAHCRSYGQAEASLYPSVPGG